MLKQVGRKEEDDAFISSLAGRQSGAYDPKNKVTTCIFLVKESELGCRFWKHRCVRTLLDWEERYQTEMHQQLFQVFIFYFPLRVYFSRSCPAELVDF